MVGANHGHWDAALVGAPLRYGIDPGGDQLHPGSARSARDEVILLPYNDLPTCAKMIEQYGDELNSVLVEPVLQDGYIPPADGFLAGLRAACDGAGSLLIFDEMITMGLARGGAQDLYGVVPDLTAMGKVMGGGMPFGAVGGSAEVMKWGDPAKVPVTIPVGGTFGGHHVAVAAGLAQLKLLTADVFAHLHALGEQLRAGVAKLAAELDVPLSCTGVGHLNHLHWSAAPIADYQQHVACDHRRLRQIDSYLHQHGFFTLIDGPTHLNAAMSASDVDDYLSCVRDAIETVEPVAQS
jgi:glutamate-1-semialdehyde 2,1-aminomutase